MSENNQMPLQTLKEFYPNYKETFNGEDIKSLDLYTDGGEKIGSIDDVLVDQNGKFRYLVISTEILGFGKNILLPIGLSRIDYEASRAYAIGMSKDQVERLPEYKNGVAMDHNHEHQIRVVYEGEHGNDGNGDRTHFSYDQDPSFYEMNDQKHRHFKSYEDRLRSSHQTVR